MSNKMTYDMSRQNKLMAGAVSLDQTQKSSLIGRKMTVAENLQHITKNAKLAQHSNFLQEVQNARKLGH